MRNRSTAARRYDDAVARYGDGPSACLAALGLLSPGFLVLVFAAGRAAPGYSPLRDEVSELALGVTAAVLDGGLIGFGMLVCLFAAGLWRSFRVDAAGRCGALLLALSGVTVAALAVFPTDVSIRRTTVHGTIHDWLFFAGVGMFVGAGGLFARAFRRDPLWRRIGRYTRVNAVVVVAVWVVWLAFASQQQFDPRPPLGAVAGLIERVLILCMTAG
jgi:hypothetical membrane protein